MSLLNIEQKKGNPDRLDGRLIVYAFVDVDPSELISSTHPILSMLHNGFLVAQGNYKEHNSLKDFLKSELGESLEEGFEVFIEKLDGLEGALDPQKLKEKMKNLDEIKDFIPTPAKIVTFHSESEILEQEGDVFFVGNFTNMANANLSVNSFPIIYQAQFREQQIEMVKKEVEQLISQIESNELPDCHYKTSGLNIAEKILKYYIPDMLYSKKDDYSFKKSVKKFKGFLSGYKFTEDIDHIIFIISNPKELTSLHHKLLELYTKKIVEVSRENFSEVDTINKEILSAEKKLPES